jgi:hypothetical protein
LLHVEEQTFQTVAKCQQRTHAPQQYRMRL